MIKRKLAIIAVCALIITSFCGCTEMIALTDGEEEEIAIYISSLIGKYNRNQQKGLSYVSKQRQQELLDEQLIEAGIMEEPTAEETSAEEVSEAIDPETGFIIEPDTGFLIDPATFAKYDPDTKEPLLDENGEQVYAEMPEQTESEDGGVSSAGGGETNMGEIIPIDGASFSYNGAKMTTHYGTEYYDLSPTRGYEFLEMTFTLDNTTDSDLDVDTTSYGLVFRAKVNGVTAKSDQTILINDLKSYIGTVPAGESVDLVLLFQYPSGQVENLDDLTLEAEYGGSTYQVSL